jgi:putative DNA primase/helicase
MEETIEDIEQQMNELKSKQKILKKSKKISDGLKIMTFSDDWKGLMIKDTMSGRIIYGRLPPWHNLTGSITGTEIPETDIPYFIEWFEDRKGISFTKPVMWDLINTVANQVSNKIHPLTDYLSSLYWDGKPRLDDVLFDYGGVVPRDQAHKKVLQLQWKVFIMGAVKRAFEPGCKFDTVFILDGVQYLGKSSFWKILAGEKFFSDTPIDLNSKDAYLNIQGVWFYELAELEAFGKADSNRQKTFFSSCSDRVRVPYSIKPIDLPRATVMVGTTNDEVYLKDPTGNRRYFTATVSNYVDQNGLAAARDQIWAEAVKRFSDGELWYLSPDEKDLVEAENISKSPIDSVLDAIRSYHIEKKKDEYSMNDIYEYALCIKDVSRRNHSMATRIGMAMPKLGFVRNDTDDGIVYKKGTK